MPDKLTNNEIKIIMDNLAEKIDTLDKKFDKFIEKIENNYVSKIEFKPFQKAMYVVTTTVLLTLVAYGMDKILN